MHDRPLARLLGVAVSLGFLGVSVAAVEPPVPPASRVEPVTETVHGVEITDPYRWLEGDEQGSLTPEVAEWTAAQNAYTRAVLDNLPGRKAIEDQLRPLMEIGSISTPKMAGNRYFYSKREESQAQPIVYVREGYDGLPSVLLDPTAIDPSGLTTIAWYVPNEQGTLMAFGMYRAGDEKSTLYVMDIDKALHAARPAGGVTAAWMADEIPGKVGNVSWLADSSGFFYRKLADTGDNYSNRVCFHRLGASPRADAVLVDQHALGPLLASSPYSAEQVKALETTYGPFAYISRDDRWMIIGYSTGTRSNDLWVVDLDQWFRTGGPEGRPSAVFAPRPILTDTLTSGASGGGPIDGDTMYMETTLDAPNGRVVAVDLNNPSPERWREIVPTRQDAVLTNVSLTRGMLVGEYLVNATSRIEKFAMDGTSLGQVELPNIGSASIATAEDRTEAFLAFESFNTPDSIYRVDLRTGERTLWERPSVPIDPSDIEVSQVWYSSKDGTRVPMFVVHRKGLKLDGNNPTTLYAYGGFNVSLTPSFSPTLVQWFQEGGVFALPNIRGGGEFGDQWHRGGMLASKQNVFDDFIAAAEWLIENGYTRPEKLAINGGSNGGLLTGAVLTQRPDLFAAVISDVPLLDMIRYQRFLMGRYWIPEYGSSEDAEQFEYLYRYSPYHHVKKGTAYPAVLLKAGEHDARVHPMHARKMAALLQASTSSDPAKKPVLLWVEQEAGHGGGKPLEQRVQEVADLRMFLMWQLGMLEDNAR